MANEIDGALTLRTGVYTASAVLGSEFSGDIDGVTVTLRLPKLANNRSLQMEGSYGRVSHNSWGYQNSKETATIKSIAYRMDHKIEVDSSNIAFYNSLLEKLGRDLWWWLAIAGLEIPDIIADLPAVTWAEPDNEKISLESSWSDDRFTESEIVHDRQSWEHALDHIYNGDDTPTAIRLLLLAQENFARGDLRPAILDASTAMEVSLTWALREVTRKYDVSGKLSKVVLDRKTLGALAGIAKELGIPLPANLNNSLIGVRNKAIHEAAQLDRDSTKKAINVASEGIRLLREKLGPNCAECTRLRK